MRIKPLTIIQGANDIAWANLFGKISRYIIASIRSQKGETDPSLNLGLASALSQARQAQMSKANIEQAVRKGASKEAQCTDNATTVFYEGLGPDGVACIVEALTNNRNKTFNEVRHVFYEHGSLTSVSYLFRRSGFVLVECATTSDGDTITNDAIDTGLVLDVHEMEPSGQCELECEIKDVLSLKRLIEAKGHKVIELDVRYESESSVPVQDHKKFEAFLEEMEGLGEVVRVHHNASNESE